MYSKSILQSCGLTVKSNDGDQKKANTTDPTGKIDMIKLLGKEDDFWETQVSTQSWEKQVVVITDWSLKGGKNLPGAIFQLIYTLMDKDFELYAWTGELVEIHSRYDLYKAIENIQPIPPSHLEKSFALKGKEKDRLKVIDYFEIRRIEAILKGEKEPEPTFNFHDIDQIASATIQESIFNSFSSYLFFTVYVDVSAIAHYDLLLKWTKHPQFKGFSCSMTKLNSATLERFIATYSAVPYGIKKIQLNVDQSNVLDKLLHHNALKNLKEITILPHYNIKRVFFNFDAFSEQLNLIKIEQLNYGQIEFGSLNSLQHLELTSCQILLLQEILPKAPNIETLHLIRDKVRPRVVNTNKIELLKLKKLSLKKLWLDEVLELITISHSLEELILDDVVLAREDGEALDSKTLEKITQLKKLSIKSTLVPIDFFILLIQNNSHLEEIQLANVKFLASVNEEIKLTELVFNYSHFLSSLRSIKVLDDSTKESHSIISTLLARLPLIEEIELATYLNKSSIDFRKNHHIILKGSNIEPACLSLFLEHSDYVEYITIDSELIAADFVNDNLLAHQNKMTQLKKLSLPNALQEKYLASYPNLKWAEFKNSSIYYGRFYSGKNLNFQELLAALSYTNSALSELFIANNSTISNESFILEYNGILPFKSLIIVSDNISAKAISKLINNSPYLESLKIYSNQEDETVDIEVLSNCLEELTLKNQSKTTICNFLKHNPLLMHLELDLEEGQESLLFLLEPWINTSFQLNSLVIRGHVPSKTSQNILNCLIKNNYEMHKLVLGNHFVFEKNETLIAKILTQEHYLYKLLQSSPQLTRLHVNQSVPILKMLEGRLWNKLEKVNVVSCLDTLPDNSKSPVETFDFMLSVCPSLDDVCANFYNQQSFFIVNKIESTARQLYSGSLAKLQSSDSLSASQLAKYWNKIANLTAIDIKAVDGILLDESIPWGSLQQIVLKDTSSLLNNFDFFLRKMDSTKRSLISPYVKLTHNTLELHADKLSEEDILHVLKLVKWPSINIIILHNKLTTVLVNALKKNQRYNDIHLVNVRCDVDLINQLIRDGVTLTAKNSSQQVVYKIKQSSDGLKCSGVQLPPSLLVRMICRISFVHQLQLKNISLDAPLQWPENEKHTCRRLFLEHANITMEFLEHWAANCKFKVYELVVLDCPTLPNEALDKFVKKYQISQVTFQQSFDHIIPQQSSLSNKALTEESFLNAMDAKTGEQSPNSNFPKPSTGYFRQKRNKQPYPNYIREQVQLDGKKTIKTCKEIPFAKDVVKQYEELYKNKPDYYLAQTTTHLTKKTWYPLPSLTPEDALVAFFASKTLELGYSDKTNLFYIRSAQSFEIEIAYIIRAKLAIRYSDEAVVSNYQVYFPCIQSIDFVNNTIDEAFKEQFLALQKASSRFKEELLIAFCRFDVGDLSNASLQGKALLNALIRERKGVCRHNVTAFLALKTFFNQNLPSHLKIKARAILSTEHAFIEIKVNNQWQMICLGGAEMPEATNTYSEEEEVESKPHAVDIKPPQTLDLPSSSSSNSNPPLVYQNDTPLVIENKLQDDATLPNSVSGPEVQEDIKPTYDFSYVLALNPFNSSKKLKTLPAANFSELAQKVIDLAKDLNPGESNLMLNFECSSQIEQFYAAMASKLTTNHNRFLLIHSLNAFNPKEFIIDGKTQKPVSQPKALVKEALAAQHGDFLLVNLSNYNEKSVSTLNALTDRLTRRLANHPLPNTLTILGVKLNQTEVGNDVYSRFLNAVYFIPYIAPQPFLDSFRKPISTTGPDEEMLVVDFYNGDSWKSQLQGSLDLKGKQLEYKKGALVQMLEAGKSRIRFYNLPTHLEEFRVFLMTLLCTRQFDANGVTYYLPEDFYYESATKTYHLASPEYHYALEEPGSEKKDRLVLNATTYHHFFNNVYCKEGNISQKSGWLLQYAQQELTLRVTGLLHDALWAKLLDTAKTHHCQLRLSFESSQVIPQSMRKRLALSKDVSITAYAHKNHIIVSNDLYFAQIECQSQVKTPMIVLEVNENTKFSTLFERIQVRKNAESLTLDWHSCPVREYLLKGYTVILKGCINQELADRLHALLSFDASVFVNGKHETYNGQLILLLDENKYFHSATVLHKKYGFDDFYQQLATIFPENWINSWELMLKQFLQKAHDAGISLHFNYVTLQSMLNLYQKQPQSNCFLPFILLHPKYKVLKQLALSVYPETKPEINSPEAFDAHRRQMVSNLLDFSSSGFLVGASGVGKTTFVKGEFKQTSVHVGLENLEQWAKDGGLFYLDEANLYLKGSLDFFSGLFNTTPGLLLNNQFYPIELAKKHQILFGGNYSDFANRQTHAFLQQVPVIEFEALPDWYLKERVLKKALLSLTFDETLINDIMIIQLKVYHYINEHNADAGWTVRNLENMALRFLLFREERPNQSIKTAAWLSAYDELSNHNESQRISLFQDWIEAQYPLKDVVADLNRRMSHKTVSFSVTDCRQNVFRLMQDQVKIQGIKAKYPQLRDFGAVCGCLLEGESGLGKSKFALELAKSLGYHNGDESSNASVSKSYYLIAQNPDKPMRLDSLPDEMGRELHLTPIEQRLTTLFHEGALVIIDEFSSFRLEKLLNALMSGVDLSMQPAKKPGFFVFATQNPIHYIGRKKLGSPLENRMFKLEFLDYSPNGLYQIAKYNGLHPIFAKASAAFFHQSSIKNHNNTTIEAPNFRQYLEKIKSIQEDNPISTWYFLEKVYRFLAERDRQALHCTSLFCLSAFALLHQPTLFDIRAEEQVIYLNHTEHPIKPLQEEAFGVSFSEEETETSSSEEVSASEEEPSYEGKNQVGNNPIEPVPDKEVEIEQNSCFSSISMQVLGGFMAVLGASAVAVAFVLLNASTFGLAGFIALTVVGGVSALAGLGLFTAGVVNTCSSANEPVISC